MAKKSGSKSSRSERRAGRQRSERAREHGLPPRKEPVRARAATPESRHGGEGADRSSETPPARVASGIGIPTLAKVLGGAVLILVGVYLLSRQRDGALTEAKPGPEQPRRVTPPPSPAPVSPQPIAPKPVVEPVGRPR